MKQWKYETSLFSAADLRKSRNGLFRDLFEKKGWFQDTPIDMAFMVGYFVIILVSAFLRAWTG